MKTLQLNGVPTPVEDGTLVADLVALLTDAPSGVAVAVDDTVVPRSLWATTVVPDGARVEVLTAVQGG